MGFAVACMYDEDHATEIFRWTCKKNDIRYLEGFIGQKARELKKLKACELIYHRSSKDVLRKIRIKPHKRTTQLKQISTYPYEAEIQRTEEEVSQAMHEIAVVCAIAGFIFIMVSMLI